MVKRNLLALCFMLQATLCFGDTADALLDRLAQADTEITAQRLVGEIWTAWTYPEAQQDQHGSMDIGIRAMRANALDQAERIFSKVLEAAPDYAEAWNKRATVRFMRGDFVGSEADVYQVLTREPRHFGALAGLGMINMHLQDFEKALNAYQKVRKINPYSIDAQVMIPELKRILGRVDL